MGQIKIGKLKQRITGNSVPVFIWNPWEVNSNSFFSIE